MEILLTWLWQGAIVTGATAVLLGALRRAHARHRYVVCAMAWLTVLLLPVLELIAPTISISSSFVPPRDPAGIAIDTSADRWNWTTILMSGWIAWMTVATIGAVRALRRLRKISTSASSIPSSIESYLMCWSRVRRLGRQTRLVHSTGIESAGVLVGWRPIIALSPAVVDALETDELDQVILHEWAHIQRRDDLANLVVIAGRVVAGWHPAMWWLTRQLELEREIACDEMVVELTGGAKRYASCLTELADRLRPSRAAAIPGMLSGSVIARRVLHVLGLRRLMGPSPSAWLSTGAVVGLWTIACGMASVELTARPMTFLDDVVRPRLSHVIANSSAPNGTLSERVQVLTSTRSGVSRAASAEPTTVPPDEIAESHDTTGAEPLEVAQPVPDVLRPEDMVVTAGLKAGRSTEEPTGSTEKPTGSMEGPSFRSAPTDDISPWKSAADGGVAIGRSSQKAAVTTAGLFTRFAKSVAGSFKD